MVICEEDFRTEMFVPLTSSLVDKFGLRDAYVLAAIRFRTNTKHEDTVDDPTGYWWRTTAAGLADFLGMAPNTVRASLKSLVEAEILESAFHLKEGWDDRTLSYRTHLTDSGTCNCRVRELPLPIRVNVPLLSKEVNNPADSIGQGVEEKKPGPRKLPDDWMPNDKHRVKADVLGVDMDAAAEQMRKWAFANDTRKKDWDRTFNNFLASSKPSVVSVPSAESQVDRIIASGDREALERLTGVRFDPDFGDVSPRERFELLKESWPGWARENRARLVSAAVSHSKPR